MQSGALHNDETLQWKLLNFYVKKMQPLVDKIETGSIPAMHNLGLVRFHGDLNDNNIGRSYESAFEWFSKASDADHSSAMAMKGKMLCEGKGCLQNIPYGLICLATAAGMGSAFACFMLGVWHEEQKYGLLHSEKQTRIWLKKALHARCRDGTPTGIEYMNKWLADHPEPT